MFGAASEAALAASLRLSEDDVRENLQAMRAEGLLADFALTGQGENILHNFKVDNAVIMAAGMSTRFAPVSYARPKGLVMVRGEVLIERQIRQLQAAGIDDITVVLGYKKEQFFYLEDKFGVKFIINPDYHRYNNISSLYLARHELKNTYLCSSDNYFTVNVFEPYVYKAYYSCVYNEGETDEYCVAANAEGIIDRVAIGGHDSLIMLGHVFFSREFSRQMRGLLEKEYGCAEVREMLWEKFYLHHLADLSMEVREYSPQEVWEFDSIDDVQSFDPEFLEHVESEILDNIVSTLHCHKKDIGSFVPIKEGMTNLSFSFVVDNVKYVYRHPGQGTEEIISRESEYFSQQKACELGLDKTFIAMDADRGWKISYYLENNRDFDYHRESDVRQVIALIRKLHQAQLESPQEFSLLAEAGKMIKLIRANGRDTSLEFADFDVLSSRIAALFEQAEQDGIARCLCHVDCYAPNFLTDGSKMYLIDWEYSGYTDPAGDLGTMICCSDYNEAEVDGLLELYFGRKPSLLEERHWKAYIAIAAYYWFVWALYKESIGNHVGEFLYIWYKYAKKYCAVAEKLYEAGVE